MGITMTVTGRLGKPERPSFLSRRAHLLTTARRAAVVSLPLVGPCALPEASAGYFSRGADNAAEPLGIGRHCLCGWQTAFALFASSLQTVVPFRDNLPPACENLPPAALSQLWTMLLRTVHFLLSRQKKQNRPLQLGRKEVKDYGDLSPGSEGGKPRGRPFCLRSFRLP